mmetsp:Transcript_102421/g.319064  ORF Transcript_102421/g.319064 Transcript_102421/m.319064 type:complete len:483 (-) Transcript_102421:136-1584(-)|eukprot:CAMPEP_0204601624 /NCGR_PEP_ID=MMETSP0661-20131031/56148_1 /ASSEMBLY_ACC=CAM_ASM_000606 /TAXON_ID=109239 /ORGANISM="Alexandrium margalefi, Strain AMGDE01CS-322" /LENGTH=482 /DNA_ID=CAMNT_0051612517 /DNA_START=44 /DNA_END=1492 /DNA_ORIENTATION=+
MQKGKQASKSQPVTKVAKAVLKRKSRQTDVKGLREAKKATTMTSQEWKKLQVGMKEKWPQPDYMKVPHPEGKGHTCYRDETFELVTRFRMETKILYRPHAKAPGTKSHVRYEEYSKAKTVGQALDKGSWPADWCWDVERGYIKVLGPLREEPLDTSEVTDESTLTDVDRAVLQWYKKELAKKYNLNYKDLVTEKGAGESVIMRAHRLVSQREAKQILADCKKKKRIISDDDILLVLSYWGFERNVSRVNVMQKNVKWVWSDTLGLLRDRCGDIHLTKSTLAYPEVVELFSRWLTDRLPATEAQHFSWTSLNVNKNYAGKIHRDGNNFGPSMISAFGDFSGGKLRYYSHDDGKVDLEELQAKTAGKADRLDLKSGLALFNGNSAHSVEDFEGSRYSIVYFTLGCHGRMKEEDRERLEGMGVATPRPDEDPYKIIRAPRGERSSRRYGEVATPARKGDGRCGEELPASRFWEKAKLMNPKKRKA